MREITYSQGLIIEDPSLLSTLSVFCKKVWLPETKTAEAVADSFAAEIDASGPWERGEAVVKAIRSDNTPVKVQTWELQHKLLFEEGVLNRLPRSFVPPGQQSHREDFSDKSIEEIFGANKPIYERLALRYHLTRADLPGLELFDCGEAKQRVDLAAAVFHLSLPQLNAEAEKIMELRHSAQHADIGQFWDMIEEQAAYGKADGKPALARAEKIRSDFKKWKDDFFKFRGALLGTGLLTTLCWYSSAWAPLATFAAMAWLGEVNRWWVARKEQEHVAFKFINRIDSTFAKL